MKELTLKEIQTRQLELAIEIDKMCQRNNITYYLISGSCLGAVRHGGFIPWDDDIDIALMRKDYDRFIDLFDKEFDPSKYILTNDEREAQFTPSLSRIIFKGTELDEPQFSHLNFNKGMFLDVFPLDNVPNDMEKRMQQERELRHINKLIHYKIWAKSTGRFSWIKNLTKTIRTIALLPISLKSLKQQRYGIITRYKNTNTECVSSMASKYGYSKHIMPRNVYGNPSRMDFDGYKLPFPEQAHEHLRRLFGENYMVIPPEAKREKPTRVFIAEK